MKLLWIVNVPLPEVSIILGEKTTPFGGWLVTTSKKISQNKNIKLNIAYPSSKFSVNRIEGERISYWPFSKKRIFYFQQKKDIESIIERVNPDLIHIFGTEMNHSYFSYQVAHKNKIPYVISIQGLTSFISHHYTAYLPHDVIKGKSLRNLLFRDNIYSNQRRIKKQGKKEVEIIQNSQYVIGRTEWDYASCRLLNPKIQYYHCNEILREGFYNKTWNYGTCQKETIFVSQGSYPLKGLHILIEALPAVLKYFPNTKVYISGPNPIDKTSLKTRLRRNYYGIYLEKLIKTYHLENHIYFLGTLTEHEMIEQYLKTNLFVLPSSIENSPNSLGEAMLLGVPSVSAYVGGVKDMLEHGKEGFLYQADAHYMLSYYICKVFESGVGITPISQAAQERAKKTHNIENNILCLISVYEDILIKSGTFNFKEKEII